MNSYFIMCLTVVVTTITPLKLCRPRPTAIVYGTLTIIEYMAVFCSIWWFSEAEVDMVNSESEGGDDVDETLPFDGG
jgi:hypothetical protein